MISAFDRGLAFLRSGDLDASASWLDRARRLEPRDVGVALALGSVLVRLRDERAIDIYNAILRLGDLNEALCGLASALWMVGDFAGAADTRSRALSTFVQQPTQHQADALRGYCLQAGAVGWCALCASGNLTIAFIDARCGGKLTVHLDDMNIGRPRASRDSPLLFQLSLPPFWEKARCLSVQADHGRLLGAIIEISTITRVEGLVWEENDGITGWAWCPHDPTYKPILTVRVAGRRPVKQIKACCKTDTVSHWRPFARIYGFKISAGGLGRVESSVDVVGRDQRSLYGAPLYPSLLSRSASFAAEVAAQSFSSQRRQDRIIRQTHDRLSSHLALPSFAQPRGQASGAGHFPTQVCSVVIPVYNARDQSLQCLSLVLSIRIAWMHVVVVDDASNDPQLGANLDALAEAGDITLLRHARNRGFPAAVNTGLTHCAGQDVVLLNSDTVVAGDWLQRLRTAAYSAPDIGTVTPFSNDGTILSYPVPWIENAAPDVAETTRLDRLASGLDLDPIEIPTAIGFCMFIKADCVSEVGGMRDDLFAQGYCEENDFCMRARHLGWRHVAAPNVFVAHLGGKSFGGARSHLRLRNLRILYNLYAGYEELIESCRRADPLADARRLLDRCRWEELRNGKPAVLLITHGRQGGVRRRVIERAQVMRRAGMRPICLWPASDNNSHKECVVGDGPEGGTPNLRFRVPDELEILADLLRSDNCVRAEIHNLVGHDHRVLDICGMLNVPYDVIIHDYAWFCPRITLLDGNKRYCGEPDISACEACVADNGHEIEEAISVVDLNDRSSKELIGADQVMAPSSDAAERMRRHFPFLKPVVQAWEPVPAFEPVRRVKRQSSILRICVQGAIGYQKGFDVVLACARDAARRNLRLKFIVVGYSCDDERLLATGVVQITGEYQEDEAATLVASQNADAAFLPSVWPETWSYTLSQAWHAGLKVLAFDIGAPAERISETGFGWLLPLHTPASEVNDFLLREVGVNRTP